MKIGFTKSVSLKTLPLRDDRSEPKVGSYNLNNPLDEAEFSVLDVETTGLTARYNGII